MAKSNAKILIAVAAGVAAGIGIGMLIAPAKGSKTRKRLKKKIMGFADMMQDDFTDKFNAFKTAFGGDDEGTEPVESTVAPEQERK